MNRFFQSFYERTGLITDVGHRSVVSRISALTVQGIVGFTLLGTLGVDTSPLIATAGITGATLGFACKDFGANFVASIALAGQPSLRTGNRVTIGTGVAAVTGTIVDWDTRYLYMRNDENAVLSVPNNLILNSVVMWSNPDQKTYPGLAAASGAKEWTASVGAAVPARTTSPLQSTDDKANGQL